MREILPRARMSNVYVGLLVIAALVRLHLQLAAMPPYAGLDEIYHVARLAFVVQEGRNPTMSELSVPPYLASSIAGDPQALPAFGVLGAAWPAIVAAREELLKDKLLSAADMRPYVEANYEAQQPSAYYSFAGAVARLLPQRTPLSELRFWRVFSAIAALVIVIATALIGYQIAGSLGVVAAALMVSLPTWLTLIVRASNDALACALIAVALSVTLSKPTRQRGYVAEALLWAGALAVKLYSWPIAVVLPFIWRAQVARPARYVLVLAAGAAAVAATVVDLTGRTNNPLGLFAFDPPPVARVTPAAIAYGEMARIFVASFAWTSAQHWNALRPLAIAVYLGPILVVVAAVTIRHWTQYRTALAACGVAGIAFLFAQAINLAGYLRAARASGLAMPAGGKEGWYWYALAPLGVGVILTIVFRHLPPRLIIALSLWILGWDIVIHEGALFQDFAGYTTSNGGDWLFRWGPRALPFQQALDLERVSVGPGVKFLPIDRFVHIASITLLLWLALRRPYTDALAADSTDTRTRD